MNIALNKSLDKEIYVNFREGSVGGVDFGKKISAAHPGITLENHDAYIDAFYVEHAEELAALVRETARCFEDVRKLLLTEIMSYFGSGFDMDSCACYLSIFDCNPRFLDTKSFQVYYKRPYGLRKEVIAHELTHFAFYDFCFKLGYKESKELWELSEIFNVIFLNFPALREAIGAEELLFYPALKDKLERVRAIWDKRLPAADFIRESMRAIESGCIMCTP